MEKIEEISDKPLNLKLKDRKILMELDFGARQTNSQIAKKVGLNKQNVDYRINSMIKKGVITSFYPLINLNRLGRRYCRLLVRFQNMTEESEAKLFDEMVRDKRFNWIVKLEGKYDMIVGLWVGSISEFKAIVDEFVSKYGYYIKDKIESICTQLIHYQSRYILETADFKEIAFREDDTHSLIDQLDISILKAISQNARKSLVSIAGELNVSTKVVAYRIKKMEKNRLVHGYRANIDNNLLGYTHYKILLYLNNVSEKSVRQFKGYLKGDPRLIYFVEEVGLWNFDIECMFRT
ncbi:MAG: Lrp/AsnC family transcriptional regulator, partial [archaeon]|nr:Lrp/AsnC family transcriptional regulator [archaeon]